MLQSYSANTHINQLRQAIYQACGVAHLKKASRPRKLRRVCPLANGLDLRRKTDVVYLAQQLGIIPNNVVYIQFGKAA